MSTTFQIELDGEKRPVTFNLNAFSKIEERTGQKFGELFEEDEMPAMTDVRTVLWAGLQVNDEALTEEDVGAMVDLSNMNSVFETLFDKINEATEGGDEEAMGKSPTEAVNRSPSTR